MMKRFFLALGVVVLVLGSSGEVFAYQSPYADIWRSFVSKYRKYDRPTTTNPSTSRLTQRTGHNSTLAQRIAALLAKRRGGASSTSTTQTIAKPVTAPSSATQKRSYNPYRYRSYRTTRTARNSRSGQGLELRLTPIKQRQPVQAIDDAGVKLFKVGFSNKAAYSSSKFIPAARLEHIKFQLLDNSGVANDPTKFAIRINGQDQRLSRDGTIKLTFHNARVARGEDTSFDIELVFKEPDLIPHIDGALRLKVLSATAVSEDAYRSLPVKITGNNVSSLIEFQPIPYATGTSSVSGFAQQIFSRTLSAGESEYVLALRFNAAYDDLVIKEITVRDTLSGGSIGSFISRMDAIDGETGAVLDSGRFSVSEARFRFNQGFRIFRNGSRSIVFRVHIEPRFPSNRSSTQFRFEVLPSDVDVYSYSTGQDLPDANKNFSFDTDTFFVAGSGGSMIVGSSGSQPSGFGAAGTLESVYRFSVTNPGNRTISLGRVTFDIRPSGGLQFNGGSISTDDFQILSMHNGSEVSTGNPFSVSSTSGTQVTFDTNNELYISRGETREFMLKVATEDSDGTADGDSIWMQILGDSGLSVGTLSQVRSAGKNFIWSDHSGQPHTSTSGDWLSGYLLRGLPTNAVVITRY